MAKIENNDLSHNMVEKSLQDVSEILKSVFGENVKVDISVSDIPAESLLKAYGLQVSNPLDVINGEHSMRLYPSEYLPFESKKMKSFLAQGIVE